jgi:hypothetical protein
MDERRISSVPGKRKRRGFSRLWNVTRHIIILLPTFRDNLSVPSPRVRQSEKNFDSSWTACVLNMGAIGGPKTSVTNNRSTRRNIQEERRHFYTMAEA